MKKYKKPRFRLLKAHSTTLQILLSFGWIFLASQLLGKKWQQRKMDSAYLRNAKRLKKMILELRGLYIKVGQLISIMSNFLPQEFRNELEGLQDKITPRPYNEIAARIKHELGASPEKIFKTFNKEPIASASLAQVHEAWLENGQKVAVKVQYMDIEKMAKLDLRALGRIMKMVEFVFKIKGISTNFKQIKEMILDELDFKKEAKHIECIASSFENDRFIKFPKVCHDFSSQRVLTTSFMEGIKASDLTYLDANKINRDELAHRIITAYCQMIFIDGVYHADPHPGNLLVQKDGSVVFIDFGEVACLSPSMKEGIPKFLEGVLKRDRKQIAESLQLMGFIAYTENGYDTERLIDYVYGTFFQEMSFDSWSLNDIQSSLQNPMDVLGDFRKMNISLRDIMNMMQVPKDWTLLERTVMLLMGLCTHLQPELNPMHTIKPYLEEFVLGKNNSWQKFIGSAIKEYLLSVVKLPEKLNEVITKADKGELNIRVKDIPESVDILYSLGHQVLYGLFCMVTGGFAYMAHYNGEIVLMKWLVGTSMFFATSLIISMLKVKRRRQKRR